MIFSRANNKLNMSVRAREKRKGAVDVDQLVGCLPSVHGTGVLFLAPPKGGLAVHACNPSTWKMKEESQTFRVILGWGAWGQSWLHE